MKIIDRRLWQRYYCTVGKAGRHLRWGFRDKKVSVARRSVVRMALPHVTTIRPLGNGSPDKRHQAFQQSRSRRSLHFHTGG